MKSKKSELTCGLIMMALTVSMCVVYTACTNDEELPPEKKLLGTWHRVLPATETSELYWEEYWFGESPGKDYHNGDYQNSKGVKFGFTYNTKHANVINYKGQYAGTNYITRGSWSYYPYPSGDQLYLDNKVFNKGMYKPQQQE